MNRNSQIRAENIAFFLITLGAALAVLATIPPFIQDDAYISFRYARNVVEGNGFTFNTGERVEGYTNFLWVTLLTIPHALGLDVGRFVHVAGSVLFLALLLIVRLGQRRLGVSTNALSWIPMVILATNKNLIMGCRSGLETGLFVLLVTAALLQCVTADDRPRRFLLGGLLFALAAMTRPEGVFFFGICFLMHLYRQKRGRHGVSTVIGLGIGFLAAFIPYYVWRLSYFGFLLPNTFYAKVGYEAHHLSAGWSYLMRGLSTDEVLAFAFFPLCLLVKNRLSWLKGAVMLTLLYLLYVVCVGGDYMEFNRFLMPVVPMVVVASFAALSTLTEERFNALPGWRKQAVMVLWCGFVLLLQFPRGEWMKNIRHKVDLHDRNIAIGQYFDSVAEEDDLLCTEIIGAIGYSSGMPILDVHGLVDLHIARRPFNTGIRKIGHEKADLEYVLDRAPRFIYAPDYVRELPKAERSHITARYHSTRGTVQTQNGERFKLPYFERRMTGT